MMLIIRKWHGYLGIFIAPSVLFFALTGALQLFSLHEAQDGYQPPPVIERLGRLHKDQVFALDEHHHDDAEPPAAPEGPPGAAAAAKSAPAPDQPKITTYALKWFFLVVALGLVTSTSFGLWIGLTRNRGSLVPWLLLAAGVVIPLALVLF